MLYVAKFLVFTVVTTVLSLLTVFVGAFEKDGKRAYQINRLWTWMVLHTGGISVAVDGLQNLDPRRSYIFMVNHQSNMDIPVLVRALSDFQLRLIAKRELFWIPFFGWALWATKHIVVDRGDRAGALETLKRAQERIEEGVSVVVFPEGTRSPDGNLLPFKRGGFLLAAKSKTPVVAVTINGSGKVLPKNDWRVRGGTVNVIISPPLTTENYRPGNLRALSTEVEQRIKKNLLPSEQRAPSFAKAL